MRLLVALKPLTHDTRLQSYAVLAEVDFEKKEIIRTLKIPAANFTSSNGYMRSNFQGISTIGKLAYLSLWNYIVIVDLTTFEILDAFSHPLMSDLHGIHVTKDEILVCSTGIDTLLCFNRETQTLKWHWRPDESALSKKLAVATPFNLLLHKHNFVSKVLVKFGLYGKAHGKIRSKFHPNGEYRGLDKTRSMLHAHHLNEVNVLDDGKIYVLTKGWNDSISSTLVELDPRTMQAKFLVGPAGFCGAHDIVKADGKLYVTESGSESIGSVSLGASGTVNHFSLGQTGAFVRGLLSLPCGDFLVGFTPPRNAKTEARQATIQRYDSSFAAVQDEMILDGIYSDQVGGAIHAMEYIG